MISHEATPRDPRALAAAERLAIAARRAFKRNPSPLRLASLLAYGAAEMADLVAGRKPAQTLRAVERRASLLVGIATGVDCRPGRSTLSRPRHHLLADDEELLDDEE